MYARTFGTTDASSEGIQPVLSPMTKVSIHENRPAMNRSSAFAALEQHYKAAGQLKLRDLFEQDDGRFERFSLQTGDLLLDYSKNSKFHLPFQDLQLDL